MTTHPSPTHQANHSKQPTTAKRLSLPQRETDPPSLTHPTLQLQQQIGNRAVGSLLQAKLTIGQPNDPYEKEADRTAAAIMRMPQPPAQQAHLKDEETLQAKPQLQAQGNTIETPDGFEAQFAKHQSSGQPLPTATRTFIEPRFGADFSHVRIHQTPALADSIHAKAFTHSNHIYFNQGQYSPGTQSGKLLLAHELTHVLQQQSAYGRVNRVQRLPEQLFTSDSFSPEMVRSLSDNDLQEKSKILEDCLQNLTLSDPTFIVSKNNLVTLRYEIARRAISGSRNSTDHQTAAKQLVEFIRQQLTTFPELIQRFIQQSESFCSTRSLLNAQEKVRILGKVVAAVARMEFLLGTIYHQGKTWEGLDDNRPNNSGYMVDSYQKGENGHWCSRFVTTVLATVTGRKSLRAGSGYKIANAKSRSFPKINLDYQEEQGGKFVGTKRSRNASDNYRRSDYNPWALLKKSLNVAGEQATTQDKERILETFFASHMRPQAGDIMVLRRDTADPNSFSRQEFESHTTIIESLDGFTLHTIEGNKSWTTRNESNRRVNHEGVRGRTFDLTDPAAVKEIVFIARPSLDSLTDNSYKPSSQGKPSQRISEEALLQPINHINQLLEIILAEREYVQIPSRTESNYVSDLGPA